MKSENNESENIDDQEDQEESPLTGLMKKLIVGGVSTMFVTQEKAKELLGDLKLPKEILEMLLANASKTKSELFKGISEEFGKTVSQVDMLEAAEKFLEGHKVKLKIDLEFEPKKKKK